LFPVYRAEHRRFCREQPEGARQGSRASAGGQEALSADPGQNRGAQGEAVTGPPFLWLLSFGGAKESSSPSGARTRLK